MTSKSPIFWGVLGVVVGVGLGYFYADQAAKNKYEPQIEVAQNVVPSVSTIYFVSGTVKDVRDSSIILEDLAFSGDPFMEVPSKVEVVIGSNATVLKRVYKDLALFQEEFTEYQVRLNDVVPGSTPPEPPQSYIDTEVDIADLEEGFRVEVHSEQNIKGASRFEASRVIFQ